MVGVGVRAVVDLVCTLLMPPQNCNLGLGRHTLDVKIYHKLKGKKWKDIHANRHLKDCWSSYT